MVAVTQHKNSSLKARAFTGPPKHDFKKDGHVCEEKDSDSDRELSTIAYKEDDKDKSLTCSNDGSADGTNPEVSFEKLEYSGIVVMHKSSTKANQLLKEFNGALTSQVSIALLQELKAHIPTHLGAARVADFNDNLSYAMPPERGLQPAFRGIGGKSDISDNHVNLIDEFEALLYRTGCSKGNLDSFEIEYQGSFMRTEGQTIPQPPHVDFEWSYLEQSDPKGHVMIGVFPLSSQGCFLQIWPNNDKNEVIEGRIVFIPYGSLLLLPCNTIHGGGFKSHPTHDVSAEGNVRFHLYVAFNGAALPRFQTNRYTEQHNRAKELSERFVNSQILSSTEIMKKLFV
jgi:hypothetical protein